VITMNVFRIEGLSSYDPHGPKRRKWWAITSVPRISGCPPPVSRPAMSAVASGRC